MPLPKDSKPRQALELLSEIEQHEWEAMMNVKCSRKNYWSQMILFNLQIIFARKEQGIKPDKASRQRISLFSFFTGKDTYR